MRAQGAVLVPISLLEIAVLLENIHTDRDTVSMSIDNAVSMHK